MSVNRQWNIGISQVEALTRAQRYLKIAQKQPSALTHQVAGAVFLHRHQTIDSIAEFKQAIDLDPSDSWSYAFASVALTLASRPDEAMKYINAAMRLDPRPPALFLYYLGFAQFNQEQFGAAAATLERATTLNPNDQYALLALGAAYGYLGRKQDAASTIGRHDELAVQQGGVPATVGYAAYVHTCFCGATSQTVAARLSKGLRLAGVPENLSRGEFFEKNRLTAQEIRLLIFGHRVHGSSLYTGEKRAALLSNDGIATLSGDWISPNLASVPGASQFRKDELCITITMTTYCGAVIRIPGGTAARENEFIWRGHTFSRVE
jgi:Flp pilus assembly protein TadD